MNNYTEPKYTLNLENPRVSLSLGNNKIGMIMNFSTLPGNQKHMLTAGGQLLTNVHGTCCGNCAACFNSCYAVNSAKLHHNVIIDAWGKNTLMLRQMPDELFKQIDEEIHRVNKKFYKTHNPADVKFKTFRINVSGELESLEQLERWNNLAKKHPEMNFGVYSKNEPVILAFFEKHGQTADNFTLNISQWHGVMDKTIAKLKSMGAVVNVFEYDDSNRKWCTLDKAEQERLASEAHCPAVSHEGHHAKVNGVDITCDMCGRCYRKTGKTTAVYDH